MASASDPGLNFKISGQVDPNFIASVAAAKDNVAKSNAESKGWQATLKSLGGTLGGAAKFVGALALEQQLHHARTKDSVAATKEQAKAIEKLTSTMAPLATQLKALVDLQTNQIKLAPQQTQAIQQQAQAMTSATSSAHTFGGAISEGSGHLDGFKNAATSAFSGNFSGAVEQLGSMVSGFAIPVAAATAAVGAMTLALNQFEVSEKAAGKAMEDDSKHVQQLVTSYHGLQAAIAAAKKETFQNRGASSAGTFYDQYMKEPEKKDPKAEAIAAEQKAAEEERVRRDRQVRALQVLRGDVKDKGHALIRDPKLKAEFPDHYQDERTPVRVNSEQLEQKIKELTSSRAEMTKFSSEASKAKVEIDKIADAIASVGKAKDKISDVTAALKELGTRQALVEARDLTQKELGQVGTKYRAATGHNTDVDSLVSTVKDTKSKSSDRELAKEMLALRRTYLDQGKSISEFDDAAAKKIIEANKTKISQLGEELAIRKALGKSSNLDELATVNKQLSMTKDNSDFTSTRTGLLNHKSSLIEHGAEESLKTGILGAQQTYKELAATGTATAAQLSAANSKITAGAVAWRNANAAILGQYPKLKEQVEALLSGARAESGHIQQKTFAEQFQTLKTHIEAGANAAQGLQDRLKATKAAIDETNAAYAKGLITQKQATEELSNLTKERANQERAIAEAMAQQQKSIDALKGKMSGNELKRLEGDKAAGRDPAFFEQRKEQLQASEIKSQLKVIDDEYQAAIKGNKDQVLAAEEASLKKKLLYEQEADKFVSEEDRKTNALKAANKNRLGGEASPLVGLNEGASFSGVGFSGFGNFGDNFGKISRTRSAFDSYQDAQLPGAVGDVFKSRQSYEGAGGKAQSSTTNHYNVTAEHMPKGIVEDFCKAASEAAKYMGAVSGSGAPAMTKRSSSDVWDKTSSADSWQK